MIGSGVTASCRKLSGVGRALFARDKMGTALRRYMHIDREVLAAESTELGTYLQIPQWFSALIVSALWELVQCHEVHTLMRLPCLGTVQPQSAAISL